MDTTVSHTSLIEVLYMEKTAKVWMHETTLRECAKAAADWCQNRMAEKEEQSSEMCQSSDETEMLTKDSIMVR